MKRRIMAILCLAALVLSVAGCSKKEEKTATMTAMVVSLEGTVVTLWEFDMTNRGGSNRGDGQGQRPNRDENWQRPEGDFTRPEGDFTMPEEGFTRPEGGFFRPEEGFTRPEEDFTRPEGDFDGERPEGSQRPTRPEGERPNFGNFGDNQAETTTVDLKNAHISIQDGDIKAAGSIDDIKPGSFLTITLNSKGEATEVLVAPIGGFGSSRWQGGFSGGKGNRDKQANGSIEQAT